jgi:hypothetical protein
MHIGPYEVLLCIARGGMASVWAARQHGARGFNRLVALKTVLPELAEPEFETMFLDEARVAARIHHPNVCEVFELIEHNGVLALSMEWVDGDTLNTIINNPGKSPVLDPRIAAQIVARVACGLHAAHELRDETGTPMQLVHRDVSPQNILISRAGHVKVADFGVAKALGGSREATAVGKVRGKLSYMSPEQAQGQPLDRRSDVFSLGVVSYFATTGVHPFRRSGESHDEQFMRLLLDQVRAPSELVPGYPRELENIVMRAISRNPELRFATADEMRRQLEGWLVRSGPLVTEHDIAHAVFDRVGRFMDQRAQRIQACIRAGQDEPGTDAARLLRTSDVTFVPTTSRAEQWQGHSLTANVLPQPRSMARSMVSTLAAAAIGVAATLMFIGSRGPANDVEAAGIAPVPAALAEAAAPPPKTETTEPPALPARALPASAEAKRVARAAAQKAAQSDALAIRRSRTSAELHRAPRRDTPADSRTDAVTKPSRGDVVAPAPSRRSSPSRVRPSRTMGPLKNGP